MGPSSWRSLIFLCLLSSAFGERSNCPQCPSLFTTTFCRMSTWALIFFTNASNSLTTIFWFYNLACVEAFRLEGERAKSDARKLWGEQKKKKNPPVGGGEASEGTIEYLTAGTARKQTTFFSQRKYLHTCTILYNTKSPSSLSYMQNFF